MRAWLKRIVYVSALLVALSGMVLITMPVQFIVGQFGLPDDVRIGHLSGTVWSGRATEVAYLGKIGRLTAKDTEMELVWRWCPGRSQGLVAVCARVESSMIEGEGTLGYSLFDRAFNVFDTFLNVQIRDYPLDVKSVEYKLKGTVNLGFEHVSLDFRNDRLLTALRANGKSRVGVGEFRLGDYLWEAGLEQDGVLKSEFSGGSDRFTLKGRASLDLKARSYKYAADMKTKDAGLRELLKKAAKKTRGDTLTFSGSGKIGS